MKSVKSFYSKVKSVIFGVTNTGCLLQVPASGVAEAGVVQTFLLKAV